MDSSHIEWFTHLLIYSYVTMYDRGILASELHRVIFGVCSLWQTSGISNTTFFILVVVVIFCLFFLSTEAPWPLLHAYQIKLKPKHHVVLFGQLFVVAYFGPFYYASIASMLKLI